jgi:hypothetical protein
MFWRNIVHLLVNVNVVLRSPILVILMMEALHSSEMSVPTRYMWHNIPGDSILLILNWFRVTWYFTTETLKMTVVHLVRCVGISTHWIGGLLAPGPVWLLWRKETFVASVRNQTQISAEMSYTLSWVVFIVLWILQRPDYYFFFQGR